MDTSAAMHIGRRRAALGQVDADDPDAFNHCFAEVNGIRMHSLSHEAGLGPVRQGTRGAGLGGVDHHRARLPVALFADRTSRVKSIVVMASLWSLATISCMFTRSYGQLLAARAMIGLGEAGYGSAGAALIASHFPARMRGALMACFFAAASVGSVLGVMLGGVIAARWGWKAAFGVVGFPGLLLALLYLKVRDYRTVELAPARTGHALDAQCRAGHHQGADWFALPAVGVRGRWGAADRGLRRLVVAAELSQPRVRPRARPGGSQGGARRAVRRRRQRGVGCGCRPCRHRRPAPSCTLWCCCASSRCW